MRVFPIASFVIGAVGNSVAAIGEPGKGDGGDVLIPVLGRVQQIFDAGPARGGKPIILGCNGKRRLSADVDDAGVDVLWNTQGCNADRRCPVDDKGGGLAGNITGEIYS